jgi:DNA-binding beta-propeller fold protein YncE
MSTQVIKFDPNGRIQMILSRKPEAVTVPNPRLDPLPAGVPVLQPGPEAGRGAGRGGPPAEGAGRAAGPAPLPGAGPTGETFNRPTDVAWDAQGNIYVADGYGNARIAKYDRNGKWIKNWGSRGSAQGQFNIVHGLAVDAQGNVYVADEGNKRVQVFDSEGTFKTQFTNVGTPTALCISRGPQQVLYVAHTGDPDGMEDAAIYKLDLNGTVLGKFGSAGKEVKQFGLVNSIDCRNPNELLVGELSNWRVQKVTLRASR